MARIKLLADEELTDATRTATQHMDTQAMDTSTLRGLANSPELCEAYNAFYLPARKGYPVPEGLIELVRLRIARHNDCFT